jgi:hypothetical protein
LRSSPDIDKLFAADMRILFEGQLGMVAPALRTIQGTGAFGCEMPLGVSVTADKVPLLLVDKETTTTGIRRFLGRDRVGLPPIAWSASFDLSIPKSIEVVMDVNDIHLCENIRFPSLTRLKFSFKKLARPFLAQDIAKSIIAAAPDTLQTIDMVDATENSVDGHSCERFEEAGLESDLMPTLYYDTSFFNIFARFRRMEHLSLYVVVRPHEHDDAHDKIIRVVRNMPHLRSLLFGCGESPSAYPYLPNPLDVDHHVPFRPQFIAKVVDRVTRVAVMCASIENVVFGGTSGVIEQIEEWRGPSTLAWGREVVHPDVVHLFRIFPSLNNVQGCIRDSNGEAGFRTKRGFRWYNVFEQ